MLWRLRHGGLGHSFGPRLHAISVMVFYVNAVGLHWDLMNSESGPLVPREEHSLVVGLVSKWYYVVVA